MLENDFAIGPGMPESVGNRPRVGVSHCLLGEPVRHDGGHKLHSLIANILGPHVQWVYVCPEVELGLAVPREPLVLTGVPGAVRLIGKGSGKDYTGAMEEYCRRKALELRVVGLDGFIFKKSSPSCGVMGVNVYANVHSAEPNGTGRGFFSAKLMQVLPDLAIAEEDDLNTREAVHEFLRRLRL